VAGVHHDLAPFLLTPKWQQWVHECLLPMAYWTKKLYRTRCRRRKANIQEAWEAVRAAFEQHPITQRLAPISLRNGRHGRPTASQPFSVLHGPSKAETASCRNRITISGAYPNSVTRCGPSCTTLIVTLRMVRRQPRGFSDGHFLISLRRCYRISRTCLDRGNAARSWRSVVESVWRPALRGYPFSATTSIRDTPWEL
jgi:hypothetical protein